MSGLPPRRVDRRTDEERLVRIRPWTELLQAAVADLRDVQIPLLIDARTVHVEEAAGMIAERSPRVEIVALEVVLHYLRGHVFARPDARAIGGVDDELRVRRACERPLVQHPGL